MDSMALDELYHSNSKHSAARLALVTSAQMRRRDRAVHRIYEATKNKYKTYTTAPQIALPDATVPLHVPLDDVLVGRRSHRSFRPDPLTLHEIATLLRRSYGVSSRTGDQCHRPVPSGGGLYPLDLYVLQCERGALDEGVYHYHVGGHRLQRISSACDRRVVQTSSIYPEIVAEAPLVLALVADMARTRIKYGERAYRLALLEAGHVSQNLYLIAPALGLGVVALDGFYDDQVHALLDLDGVGEVAVLVFAVGRPS